jgi:tetratricopeptide (TPR) repeat protein
MTALVTDHYAALGVAPDATAAEIRGAYFASIREATPESDPERFRLLSEAYRVLINPERRRAYDADERIPPDVRQRRDALLDLAGTDPEAAARGLAALVREQPRLRSVRFAHGVILDRLGRFRDAIPVFRSLFEEAPTSSAYATWLGDALLRSGDVPQGIALLQEAIVLDGKDPNPYACLARHHLAQDELSDALRVIDRAVKADGKVDLADLPLLMERLYILVRMSAPREFKVTVTSIVRTVPAGDEDARRYAAARLAELLKVLDEVGATEYSRSLLEGMVALTPDDPRLGTFVAHVREERGRDEERRRLLDDTRQPAWVHAFVAACTLDTMSEAERRKAFHHLAERLRRAGPEMTSDWKRVRAAYPILARSLGGPWQRLRGFAAQGSGRVTVAPAGDGIPGWVLAVVGTLVGLALVAARTCR